jgi:flagellar biosynthetic protein FlhB
VSDSGEKQLDATPQRLARARREGDVARSGELAANAAFAAAVVAAATLPPMLAAAERSAIEAATRGRVPWSGALAIVASALLPIAAAGVAGSLLHLAQNGGLRIVPVSIKLSRLDPLGGFKRMFSRETLAHATRAALAFAVAAIAICPAIGQAAAAASSGSVEAVGTAAWNASRHVAWIACAVGSIFALAEYRAARASWLRRLRMSFDERKREVREQEGDLLARGRRRAMHRALVRGSLSRVREAAFVVTNPTHIAVALAYAPPQIPVPRVLVCAADALAARVRELAAECGIPIVEDVALARALYADAQIDRAIAPVHYVAVAEVVLALLRSGALAS